MVPTTVPHLKTLVRLCLGPIGTSHDISVKALFNWRCKDDADDDYVKMATHWGNGVSVPGGVVEGGK